MCNWKLTIFFLYFRDKSYDSESETESPGDNEVQEDESDSVQSTSEPIPQHLQRPDMINPDLPSTCTMLTTAQGMNLVSPIIFRIHRKCFLDKKNLSTWMFNQNTSLNFSNTYFLLGWFVVSKFTLQSKWSF